MPISLRIPSEKEELIRRAAKKECKTRTAFILDAIDEKLGLTKNRSQVVKELAGYLSPEEARELKESIGPQREIHDEDWD
jgi:uncharacterized protein (DUF1778 family)